MEMTRPPSRIAFTADAGDINRPLAIHRGIIDFGAVDRLSLPSDRRIVHEDVQPSEPFDYGLDEVSRLGGSPRSA